MLGADQDDQAGAFGAVGGQELVGPGEVDLGDARQGRPEDEPEPAAGRRPLDQRVVEVRADHRDRPERAGPVAEEDRGPEVHQLAGLQVAEGDLAEPVGQRGDQDHQQEAGQDPAAGGRRGDGPIGRAPGPARPRRPGGPAPGAGPGPTAGPTWPWVRPIDGPPEVAAEPPGDRDRRRRRQPAQPTDRDPADRQVADRLRRQEVQRDQQEQAHRRLRAAHPGRRGQGRHGQPDHPEDPADGRPVVPLGDHRRLDGAGHGEEGQRERRRGQVVQPGQEVGPLPAQRVRRVEQGPEELPAVARQHRRIPGRGHQQADRQGDRAGQQARVVPPAVPGPLLPLDRRHLRPEIRLVQDDHRDAEQAHPAHREQRQAQGQAAQDHPRRARPPGDTTGTSRRPPGNAGRSSTWPPGWPPGSGSPATPPSSGSAGAG